jgi:hypothetical protein
MHWHDFTPKLVLEGAEKGARNSFASYTFLPDTPPVDVFAQGRSPDLRVKTSIPTFPELLAPVAQIGTTLTAYSCGGSFGIASP